MLVLKIGRTKSWTVLTTVVCPYIKLASCTLSKTANGLGQTWYRPQENYCRPSPTITKLAINQYICVGIFYSEFYKNRVKSAENRKKFNLCIYEQYVFLRTPSHDS
jgi:hypothetical protein